MLNKMEKTYSFSRMLVDGVVSHRSSLPGDTLLTIYSLNECHYAVYTNSVSSKIIRKQIISEKEMTLLKSVYPMQNKIKI